MIINEKTNIVQTVLAASKNESIEKEAQDIIDQEISELTKRFSPENRYKYSQILNFAVQERLQPIWADIAQFADVRRTNRPLDVFQFTTIGNDIKAYIQALGSTTPRSRVTKKKITLDAVEVSARPYASVYEITSGVYKMADLVNLATAEITTKITEHLLKTLTAAVSNLATPYYQEANALTGAIVDPLVRRLLRFGGATIIGDIDTTTEIANFPGFKQSDKMIENFNMTGTIGNYKGARVVNLLNPELKLPTNYVWFIANPNNPEERDLKFGYSGRLNTIDAQHIDDLTYETRLDQVVSTGYMLRDNPRMSVIKLI